jgi:hypothetical protein
MSDSTPLICTSAHLMITDWQICSLLLTSAEDIVKQLQYLYTRRKRNSTIRKNVSYIAHLRQQCHNSKFVIVQEKLLKVLKCYNFL